MNHTDWMSNRAALAALLLVAAVPATLPFSRSVELPILIGALVGLWALLRHGRELWADSAVRTLLLALGLYSLAALVSALDAVVPRKSWSNGLTSLRYGLYGLGVLALLLRARRDGMPAPRLARLLSIAAAAPVAVWVIDGLVQAISGHSIGGTLDADRLSGIFGADDLKLGPLLAALAPLVLWPLIQGSRWRLALAFLAVLIVVLLAGARAGWVSLLLVALLLGWRLSGGSWRWLAAMAAALALVALLIGSVAYRLSTDFQARVDRTLLLNQGQVDQALAGRTWIWQTAAPMIEAHPLNGVGARGFRYAYPDYAAPGDPWVDLQTHTGAAHAHQIVLELFTETGVFGLLMWVGAMVLLIRLHRRRRPPGALDGPWVALAVLVFPLNTHLAFYSAFMGIVLAWLLCLCCAQCLLQPESGHQPE